MRRFPGKSLEDGRKMSLRLKANAQCDLHKGIARFAQQFPGLLHPLPQEVLVWPNARRDSELTGEMHWRQAGRFRHVRQSDRLGQIDLDVSDYPLKSPMR